MDKYVKFREGDIFMSDKEKFSKQLNQEQGAQAEKKIVTNYDRKMEKRKKEEEKAKREKKITLVASIVIGVALVCFIASFPIRNYLAINEAYIQVDGDKVTQVEFDYNYNLAKNNYLTQYGSYLSYFGIDTSADLSTQMYTDTLSFQDFFEQMAVDNIKQTKALRNEADAEGFTYDSTEEYNNYVESLKSTAEEQGVTVDAYLQSVYGSYATQARLKTIVKEAMYVGAYYEKIAEDKAPTEEAIQTYYEENADTYDSVDYRMTLVEAVLPTEPALSEETTTTEDTNTTEETTSDTTEEVTDTDVAYEPTEEEIAAAMELAKTDAEALEAKIAVDGEQYTNQKGSSIASLLSTWLFDAARTEGDTTVLEDTTNNQYYVVAFENRYLDQTAAVDARIITSATVDGQTILDEWNSGEATVESFAALCETYSEDETTKYDGGLYEALISTDMDATLSAWLFDESRASGDTTAITLEDGTNYVFYYVGQNAPEWQLSIKSTILSTTMNEYLTEITSTIELVDDKGKLYYLQVEALEEAAAAESEAAATETEATESATETVTEETAAEDEVTESETETETTESASASE